MKNLFLSLVCLLALFSVSHASTINPPQSGQKSILANTDDGDIRAGQDWPAPRFTQSDNQTVTDLLTGLMWAKDANSVLTRLTAQHIDVLGNNGTLTWLSALNFIKQLNADKHLGYSDWRLPNLNELASLLNQEEVKQSAWLGQHGFINAVPENYWTSTSVAYNARQSWTIHLGAGNVAPLIKTDTALVWPVRGKAAEVQAAVTLPKTGQVACYNESGENVTCDGTGQDGELRAGADWPDSRFTLNSDQTVTDNVTGLVWAKSANLIVLRDPTFGSTPDGRIGWHDALQFVTRLNSEGYLGYSDWRLPNRNEMVSLVNYAETDPATWIKIQGISNLQQHYWSSTSSASSTSHAWNIDLAGSVTEKNKYDSSNGSYVWPVRGGHTKSTIQALSVTANSAAVPLAATGTLAAAATLAVSTASLPAGTTGTAYSQTLIATGGTTPYTWSRKSGSLPAGLILSTAGVISGTPTTAGTSTFTVQVKDKSAKTATKSLSISVVVGVLTISSSTLVDGYLTTTYSQTLAATGGKTAYAWSITSGSLPTGLSLAAATGKISGTPTAAGTKNITIQVKDANNTTVSKPLTITVYTLPAISTTSLPAGDIDTDYSQTLTATGGKGPLTWSMSSGTMPAGLALNAATGAITGTPTTTKTSSVTFKVTDANAKTATKAFSITINATPPSITTTTPANGYISVAYSQTLTVSGGKTPYTWAWTGGSLPAGLTLSAAGVISGTPKTAGASSFNVQVTDGNNDTAAELLTITIVPAIKVPPSTLPTGVVGSVYSQTLAASGGRPPYSWSITSGALPVGLSLNTTTGVISGTPSTEGYNSFIVQATDANNKTAAGSKALTINLPVSIATPALHDIYLGISYSTTITAIGGLPPYIWSITAGSLPAGLSMDPANGTISGTPTANGTSNFTVQVLDSINAPALKSYSIAVTGFGSISGAIINQETGDPLSGASVTLELDYSDNNQNNKAYSCNGVALGMSDYITIAENDKNKLSCSTGGTTPNTMQFNVRNPLGSDPFSIHWNGISGYKGEAEYLAQSFKPTKNGKLTKARFYFPIGRDASTASLTLQLKNGLGGDMNTHLTGSSQILTYQSVPVGIATWVEFIFNVPITLTVGQTYYIEIQGESWYPCGNGACIGTVYWGAGAAYPDGAVTQRTGGVWEQRSDTLAFETYLDDLVDVSVPPAIDGSIITMTGGKIQKMTMSLYNRSTDIWEPGGSAGYLSSDSSGGFQYNGDDLTIDWPVTTVLGDYYDQNGWLLAKVDNYQNKWVNTPLTNLLTDQFNVTFSRIYTTTTDMNGVFSFQGLPAGNYTVTYGGAGASSGVLNPGQVLNIDTPLISLPPMVVSFTSPSDRTLINSSSTTISVSGMISTSGTVSVNRVPAIVTDKAFSASIDLHEGLNTITATATNLYGQTASSSIAVILNRNPRLVAAPSSLDFGTVNNGDTGSLNVIVSNSSAANITLGTIAKPPVPFWVVADNCSDQTLLPAASCSISVQFMPIAPGNFTSELAVPLIDAIQQHLPVALKGSSLQFNGFYLPDTGQTIEGTRNPIRYTLNSANIATDDNTKLMWQRNAAATAMNWADAGTYCNKLSIDGLIGWRLPNLIELVSIQHYDVFDPTIDRAVFPLTNSSYYWTSVSVDNQTPAAARAVSFLYGESDLIDKAANVFVRCVRGTPLAASIEISTDGHTAYDQNTGLTIMRGYIDTWGRSWNQMPVLCAGTSAGYDDWRVPTIKEISLFDDFGWSSTSSYNENLSKAFVYSPGQILSVSKTDTQGEYGLRCVRGGNLFTAINGLAVSEVGMDTATIKWGTNRSATGVVEYGETSAYGSVKSDPSMIVQHSITLNGLKPATAYHYRAISKTTQGIFLYSPDQTFTTPASNVKNLGDNGNVTVMEAIGTLDAKKPDGSANDTPRQEIAKEYIRTHGDSFDFLVFLSTFDYAMPEAGAQGFYLPVKNDTQGINQPLFDYTAQFGSVGKLQGTIDLGNVTTLASNPYGPKLEEAITTLSHELMHRFGAYVRFKNLDGSLNNSLLGKDNAHWSYLLDSKGSLMYGNGWKANGDGTFLSTSKQSTFSPLDLYLMGLIPKEQVPPMTLIDNPAIDKTQLPNLGATITGTAKTVTIDDIIAAEGARIPNAATAQKQFNVGFVLLTRAGDNATAATQAIETLRKAWAGRFAELTQGKGSVANIPASLEITVDSPADGTTTTGPDVTVSGTMINTSGAETGIAVNGIPANVSGSRFIANHVPLQEGSNTLTIMATDANGLTTTTTRSVTASPGNYIRISSNIESGTAPMNISLRLDGSFIITNPQVSYSGPVPVPVTMTPGASETEHTATLTAEGTYTFTASAIGPDGQVYSDTVTVTVISLTQVDTLLKAKWSAMTSALAAGDVVGAVANFSEFSMEGYQQQFTALSASLPQIAAGMGNIRIVKVEDNLAEYDMRDLIDGETYSFYLLFLKNKDGIWKIRNF
jgi:hypothetical protein